MKHDFLQKEYGQDAKLTTIKAFGGMFLVLLVVALISIIWVAWWVWCLLILSDLIAILVIAILEARRKKQIRNKYLSRG